MTKMRLVATLPHDSGLPKDAAVNVWHFDSDQTFAEDADDTADRLIAFYQAIGPTIIGARSAGSVTVDVYNLEDAPPRIPGHTVTGTFSPASPTAGYVPEEIAICLSFQGATGSGVNMRRRRGRVYLGPIAGNIVDSTTAGTELTAAARSTIATAAAALAHGPDVGDARLAVFSRATANLFDGLPVDANEPPSGYSDGALSAGFEDVVSGWVDNAFDVQRRRGIQASARTTWVPA